MKTEKGRQKPYYLLIPELPFSFETDTSKNWKRKLLFIDDSLFEVDFFIILLGKMADKSLVSPKEQFRGGHTDDSLTSRFT
jgi:hypothetical protein